MFRLFTRRHWAIHNPLKSWTLAGLNLRECQLLVASMSDVEMKVSWAYCEGWADWKPLIEPECHDLFLHKDPDNQILPPLPQMVQDDDHEITQVRMMTVVPVQTQEKTQVRRKHARYAVKLPVEIVVSNYTFSTHTMDLSVGGFCFEDKLPDWVAGYFTVVLCGTTKKFEFTCFLAEDQKKEKFRAEIAPTTAKQVLEEFHNWLVTQKFPLVPPQT